MHCSVFNWPYRKNALNWRLTNNCGAMNKLSQIKQNKEDHCDQDVLEYCAIFDIQRIVMKLLNEQKLKFCHWF